MSFKKVLLVAGALLFIGAASSADSTETANQSVELNESTIRTTSIPTEEPVYSTPIPTVVQTVYEVPVSSSSNSWTNSGSNDTYINSRGNEVQSPGYYDSAPAGASAQCNDGTYSFSQSRRGTCSHHDGVAVWL